MNATLFVATSFFFYVLLRAVLSLIKMAWRRFVRDSQPVIRALFSPLHLMITALAVWIALKLAPPRSYVDVLTTFVTILLRVSWVWFGVRLLTLAIFTFYLAKLKAIKVPSIVPSLVNTIFYMCAFLLYLHMDYEFGLGDLILTTAIVLIVISIVFQSLLTSLFSGISINLEGTFQLGDLIQIGNWTGLVVESDWRRVRLLTEEGNEVTIPNQQILELPLTNFCRPMKRFLCKIPITVSGSIPPNRVQKMLIETLLSLEEVQKSDPPTVYLDGVEGDCLRYLIVFTITDYYLHQKVADKVRSIAWYRLRREGFLFPFSSASDARRKHQEEAESNISRIIKSLDLFSPLSSAEIAKLSLLVKVSLYGSGEIIFHEGEEGDSLYIVIFGKVLVFMHQATPYGSTKNKEIATVTDGGFFGELSLLAGEPRNASAVVMEESQLACINKQAFQQILLANPQVVKDISAIMAQRNLANPKEQQSSSPIAQESSLLESIIQFFQIEF